MKKINYHSKTALVFLALLIVTAGLKAQTEAVPGEISNPNSVPTEFVLVRISGSENPNLIDDAQGINFFFNLIQSVDERGGDVRSSFIEHLGINESDFSELVFVANSAKMELVRQVNHARNELCSSTDFKLNLSNEWGVDSLLASIKDVDLQMREVTKRYFQDEITNKFGEYTYSYLMDWIRRNIKPNINEVSIDHHKRDLALGRNPFDRVLRFCK
jgi:hypothetical protein